MSLRVMLKNGQCSCQDQALDLWGQGRKSLVLNPSVGIEDYVAAKQVSNIIVNWLHLSACNFYSRWALALRSFC